MDHFFPLLPEKPSPKDRFQKLQIRSVLFEYADFYDKTRFFHSLMLHAENPAHPRAGPL